MTIKSNLSAGGIQHLIDEIERYRKDLKQTAGKVVSDLVAEGVQTAKFECPMRTGNLYNSIVGEFDADSVRGFIRVNCPYAIYVEMGTGIHGKESPHPDKSVIGFDFQYDRNGHGENGWQYIGDDGKLHWTAGMPSRPFMYNTAQNLKSKF